MRVEPVAKIYSTQNSKDKNGDLKDEQKRREGFQRALDEQIKRTRLKRNHSQKK